MERGGGGGEISDLFGHKTSLSLPPSFRLSPLYTARVFSLIALARDDIHIQYGT